MSERLFASIWFLVSTPAIVGLFLFLVEMRIEKRHQNIAKWYLSWDMTIDEFLEANIDHDGVVIARGGRSKSSQVERGTTRGVYRFSEYRDMTIMTTDVKLASLPCCAPRSCLRKGENPFHALLVPGVNIATYVTLKHFSLEVRFHKYNIQDLVTLLEHCPSRLLLKLVHRPLLYYRNHKKKKIWRSKLPRNAEGKNCRHVYFKNLHIDEKRKELIGQLTRKISKKQED